VPALNLSPAEFKQVRHHAVLGQGLAEQTTRGGAPAGSQLGFAENMAVVVTESRALDLGCTVIIITENGCAASDVLADDGRVYDSGASCSYAPSSTNSHAPRPKARPSGATSLERPRQPRVARRLRRPLRPDLRRLPQPGTDPQAQRPVVREAARQNAVA
jgi:hypothetical protein